MKEENRNFRPFSRDDPLPKNIGTGRVTLQNYDKRVIWYGQTMREAGSDWPFLSHDPATPGTANEADWELYFRNHLGGLPPSYLAFCNGIFDHFNVPEAKPEDFDTTYKPIRQRPAVNDA
jgi:hypothetical protein